MNKTYKVRRANEDAPEAPYIEIRAVSARAARRIFRKIGSLPPTTKLESKQT